ncbi:SprT family zinc-dependent metalloprotease [Lignipirellula cremea]|uniref:SprT-like domain-containing protein n=1 Tax=Lignipirellula cremea TaxID=2528010 RepID=A0A518DWK9_9BACT|nr:SprT family zinc-dependent metalloprotease [Lignipirellula cremea]QDU96226.1 hypothetical protein Pla8534_40450 [Lignipirellula cremea]
MSQGTMEQIYEWIEFACDSNEVGYLTSIVRVKWNKRFTRRFGDALIGYNPLLARIRLSPLIWQNASDSERRETVIHETCHIVAWHLHGTKIKPHGVEWRQAMEQCGVEANRCHNIPLIGINHFHVRECPKAKLDRCIVSRQDFGLMKKTDYTLHCTLCGLAVTLDQIECLT